MTGNELLVQVKGYFPDFDESWAYLYHLQSVHNEILTYVRVKPDTTVDISLVYGQNAYTISTDIVKIWNCMYFTGAQEYSQLRQKSVDEWDYVNAYWRTALPGTPVWLDERAGQVWLYPAPNVATDVGTGYPLVRLYVQKTETITKTSTLEATVQSWDAWIYGVALRYAAAKAPERYEYFRALYARAMHQLQGFSQGKTARLKPSLKPAIPVPRIY